ncbi:MAG: nucleotidyltransferase domain-containing protein [Planctomycetes bacterium]|nr:nucleotidyltransferase domain-containing protein [Planctomycetota bacterium]
MTDVTRRIVEAFHPKKILLFGSYARGTPREDSDLDLLVLMDSTEPMCRRMSRVGQVAEVPFLSMDVLVYTPAEFRARMAVSDPFLTEVLAQGRVLYPRGRRR